MQIPAGETRSYVDLPSGSASRKRRAVARAMATIFAAIVSRAIG